MFQLYCRIYQGIFRILACFLPWRKPELVAGKGSITQIPGLVRKKGIGSVLLISSKTVASKGLLHSLYSGLEQQKIDYTIYDRTVPNPTIENVEEALREYRANGCQGIVVVGGGSQMDCAKALGARLARPGKSIPQMKGVLKVRKRTPPIFAVPTTAGTGSEVTIAAVISNPATHEKYAISDMALVPEVAVLDPELTAGLPPQLSAATGLDALTHAVEAYIGRSNTKETREMSRKAIKLFFDNIETVYTNGSDLEARQNMLVASYDAGIAFTRAYVGYVHAIAHALGGFYGIAHGLANAVLLPHVLEYYGASVYKPLAELSDLLKIGHASDTNERKAKTFIQVIKQLNEKMAIPQTFDCIEEADIPTMVERAFKEANPLYPVPKIFSRTDLLAIFRIIRA